ncbi:Gfo/Idh/MocA family protein [Roseitranquillus sediminis]|uniref:Gfo/Idh/MocA family protein n=1 Tax=Roseitranquillus sediminis TaxID=2809051 RepID=UPI001D0C90A3|nr:Gfo/Idh/MocA family oxidoreductase [Roseitranquillus sediminis]MBM9594831.1 Gfo/Idh/MocA family oxidoreductase [Roseitranquillus sediminis]
MIEPLRWGILGAAKFARQHMGPAIHEADDAVLAAIATRDVARAEPFRAFVPGIAVYDSYEALLASPNIDAVYIPLPNHLHVDWTLRALAAGKHVLTEKPVALQEAEVDQLIAARDTAGRLAAEAFMIVHHPQWQFARALVQDGAIGELRHVQGGFSFDNSAEPQNIRNRAETAGGALRDIGVYPFGATRYVTGAEPERLQSVLTRGEGVDVTAHVQTQFPGFTFTCYVSMRMHPYQEMVFHGTRGVLRLTAPFNANVSSEAQVHLTRSGHPESLWRFTVERQYRLQVEAFGRSARDGTPYPCPLEWSRGTIAMVDAALREG